MIAKEEEEKKQKNNYGENISLKDELLKEKRRSANRDSGTRARKRQKILVEGLDNLLENEINSQKELQKENDELYEKLMIAMKEHKTLKTQWNAPKDDNTDDENDDHDVAGYEDGSSSSIQTDDDSSGAKELDVEKCLKDTLMAYDSPVTNTVRTALINRLRLQSEGVLK